MENEIVAVKEWISYCVTTNYASCGNPPTGGWVLSTFNDPTIGRVVGPTTDVNRIITALDALQVHGGGDCPELSMTGIKNAAKVIPKQNTGCKIFFFTDATSKDGYIFKSTMSVFEENNCVFIPVLTGCCHECEDPCVSQDSEYCTNYVTDDRADLFLRKKQGYGVGSTPAERMYYDLASTTGGTISLTDKPTKPDHLLEFLEQEVTLGYCPTTELAGPPPFGYTNVHDCNVTNSCWDRSVRKCYCSSTSECSKDPITTSTTTVETHDPQLSTTTIAIPPVTHGSSTITTTSRLSTTPIIPTTTMTTSTTSQKPGAPTYVGLVLDDTVSMNNEIVAVKKWITDCTYNNMYTSCGNAPSGGWVLTTFNDPTLGAVTGPTTDVNHIISVLDKLQVHGGGDCPELSMSGIKNALKVIPKNNGGCKIFFFTDATAKDSYFFSGTLKLFEENLCVFIPVLTGCCHECEDPCVSQVAEYCTNFVTDNRVQTLSHESRSYGTPAERLYYDMASSTGGAIYLTDKPSDPDEMLDFLEEELTLGFYKSRQLAGPLPQGYTNKHDCNATGSRWDRSVGKCYCSSVTGPCPAAPLFPDCSKVSGKSFMADVTDNTKYYECNFGRTWLHRCPPGTSFDSNVMDITGDSTSLPCRRVDADGEKVEN
ncbi:uncharacterized protein LOC101242049 [Ciona intestinalis]